MPLIQIFVYAILSSCHISDKFTCLSGIRSLCCFTLTSLSLIIDILEVLQFPMLHANVACLPRIQTNRIVVDEQFSIFIRYAMRFVQSLKWFSEIEQCFIAKRLEMGYRLTGRGVDNPAAGYCQSRISFFSDLHFFGFLHALD
jgi:hypothetical protein